MKPKFKPGDIAIVRRNGTPKYGVVHYFKPYEKVVILEVKRVTALCQSLGENPLNNYAEFCHLRKIQPNP